MTYKQRVVRGAVMSDHIVQLFDTSDSLAATVSQFIRDGFAQGEHLLVVARARHMALIAARLARSGWPIEPAIAEGRLTTTDAETLLSRFMQDGLPHPALFRESVGDTVMRLQEASGAGLRIYGEMVEVLAEEGNFEGAQRLEELWNDLGAACSFTLLCGYAAAHFATPSAACVLRDICRSHTQVHSKTADTLSTWLLRGDAFPAAVSEPT